MPTKVIVNDWQSIAANEIVKLLVCLVGHTYRACIVIVFNNLFLIDGSYRYCDAGCSVLGMQLMNRLILEIDLDFAIVTIKHLHCLFIHLFIKIVANSFSAHSFSTATVIKDKKL